jgi:hypothetical protein
MTADLSAAVVEGIGQFAGAFTNPLAALIVVGLAWLVRRRHVFRIAGSVLGAALALPNAWTTPGWVPPVVIVLGGVLGVLLQVEFMLGVVLPILALARRVLDAIMGWFRAPNLPPRP